jgi:hypothetical protein
MHDELKDALDAAKYRVRQRVQVVTTKGLVDDHGNEYEDDSYISDELIEALRTKGDNER